jgi:hypothetical protein
MPVKLGWNLFHDKRLSWCWELSGIAETAVTEAQ